MSNSGGSVGPGWLHAEGDPQGTHRYWDGSAWQGEPVEAPAAAAPIPPVAQVPTPPAQAPPPSSFGPPPAMGTPPPMGGSYSGPPPAQTKGRSVWKLVVGLVLGAMLLVGACTFFLVRLASGPIDVSNEFLNAVQVNNFDQAWALSDPSCFGEDGPGQFETAFAGQSIEAYDLQSTNVSNTNGTSRGSSSGTVTLSGGDVRSITFVNTKVGDEWRVCGFDIGS